MMSLNLIGGEEITVVTDGEDEQKAAEGIKTFLLTYNNNKMVIEVTER